MGAGGDERQGISGGAAARRLGLGCGVGRTGVNGERMWEGGCAGMHGSLRCRREGDKTGKPGSRGWGGGH